MARRKGPRYKVDIETARTFLFEAYGLRTKVMTPHELMIIHEEYKGKFYWYHTKGRVMRVTQKKNGDLKYSDFTTMGHQHQFIDPEDVAIAITKQVMNAIKNPNHPHWWDKSARNQHRQALKSLQEKIRSTCHA